MSEKDLTVQECLSELREMFPLYRIMVRAAVGPTPTNIPYYWVHVIGKYEPSIGVETFTEAMAQVRAWHKAQELNTVLPEAQQ